ncbi:MAG: phosphotransferase [Gammaproteobacteria bacterium]|nr:phosphotransferase [Gammaproteobacteria bacterium]
MSHAGIPIEVLHHWRRLAGAGGQLIDSGLINQTFLMDADDEQFILQHLHPVFDAAVNRDIQAVTGHLRQQGLTTPLLIPCDDGALCCDYQGKIWRLLSYIPGRSFNAVTSPTIAYEAGHMAAQFHAALSDFDYNYRYSRGHVHDTPAHLTKLTRTLARHKGHRLYAEVQPLAEHVLEITERFSEIDKLPLRHCHGDLKISNIIFDEHSRAICLVDLDTVNRMAWPLEMGDALRSWCNPRTEVQLRASLDLEILDHVLTGYASAAPGWLSREEKQSLVMGLARICLELSARFLRDSLREAYFGWDNATYATRGDHNLARGRAMAALFDDVTQKRSAAEKIVNDRLGGM